MKKIIFLVITIFFYSSFLISNTQPDFLIIGVTKCGTTTLYKWITQHPKIHAQPKKEIHFFDHHFNYKKGLLWYRRHFSSKLLSGEATPGYFWKTECLEKIARYCKQSKLILILRNPVRRVISEYFRMKRRSGESLPFDHAITQKKRFRRYLGAGCYYEHLARWLKFFPRNQIHVMFLEELSVNPEQEMNKVFRFLELSDYKLASYQPPQKTKYDINEIKPETIHYLETFYRPHNEQLARMLGRKLPW